MIPMEKISNLIGEIERFDELAIAVSGGVDSMVLAYVAHRFAGTRVTAVHAVSPAVPAAATARVETYAGRHGWNLLKIDSGEMSDRDYLANPVDRCFYCKRDLYGVISAKVGLQIASGTNVDDLSDFRPGLMAARQRGVIHPFVEAGFHKSDIYALADNYDLRDLSALPAQPCLASRIETGIAVDAATLNFIEMVEAQLCDSLPQASAIRCRVTASGVHVECAPMPEEPFRSRILDQIARLCADGGRAFCGLRSYRRGSAFIHTGSERMTGS